MITATLSHDIHKMVSEKQYTDALAYFKANKTNESKTELQNHPTLASDMLSALRGTQNYDAAFEFLKIYGIQIDTTTPQRLLTSYGWLLYACLKTLNNPATDNKPLKTPADFIRKEIVRLLKEIHRRETNTGDNNQVENYFHSLKEFLFKIIVQHDKQVAKPHYDELLSVCEAIDPMHLSTENFTVNIEQKGKTKAMELASTREEWYSVYSKALFETGKYDACKVICQTALEQTEKLHYDNKIWFERRIAQCELKTGNTEKAISLYHGIVEKKKDWFLLKELSECYFKEENLVMALDFACKAASTFGPINYKVELLELLGDILYKMQNKTFALYHYQLIKIIREAEKWKVDNELLKKIERLKPTQPIEEALTKEQLKAKLTTFWNGAKQNHDITNQNNECEKGKIIKLLPEKPFGKEGFIKTEKGENVYFSVSKDDKHLNRYKVNKKVLFEIKTTSKGKKASKIQFL
jgi:cold shock CspA family protein